MIYANYLHVIMHVLQDRVESDRKRDLHVPAYDEVREVLASQFVDQSQSPSPALLSFAERFAFYSLARTCFCVVQTNDGTPYGNIVVAKGVVHSKR